MTKVLLVDDDTVVRTSIKLMTDWAQEGIQFVAEAENGRQALEALSIYSVNVVLTDIKMPVMDGLALLEAMADIPGAPATIVLSSYDEFPLVRRAFTLGAVDYLQKSEMTVEGLTQCILKAGEENGKAAAEPEKPYQPTAEAELREALLTGKGLDSHLTLPCQLACVELDGYRTVKARFGADLEAALVRPLMDLAGQVLRFREGCSCCNLSPARYIFAFQGPEYDRETVEMICRQLAKTWKTYLNLSVSVGLSRQAKDAEALPAAVEEAVQMVSMRMVLGPGLVISEDCYKIFNLPVALQGTSAIMPLLSAVKAGHDALVNEEKTALFAPYFDKPVADVVQLTLSVVYHVALMLMALGTSLEEAFDGEEYDYGKRIGQLDTPKDCEIWAANFLRHVADYLSRRFDAAPVDLMEKAKGYLLNHYQQQELSVREVADYVGLSEKYFSTKLNSFLGSSMSAYVNQLRIAKAKELLQQTDLKIYQIAETVGFANTEHFIRVFRTKEGVPPSAYKKQNRTKCQ